MKTIDKWKEYNKDKLDNTTNVKTPKRILASVVSIPAYIVAGIILSIWWVPYYS